MNIETRRAAAAEAELARRRDRTVSSLMRRHWIATSPEASVDAAIELMRFARVRHIPVASGGLLAGLVTQRRLLASTLARLRSGRAGARREGIRVAALMDPQPPVARPDETLGAAARRMYDARIGCLPVVDGERCLVGLLVESDLLRSFYEVDRSER